MIVPEATAREVSISQGTMFLLRWSQCVLGMQRGPLPEELWLLLVSQHCCCSWQSCHIPGLAVCRELPSTQALTLGSDHAHSLDPWDTCQWQPGWHKPLEVPQPVRLCFAQVFALEQSRIPRVGLPRNGEESAEHPSRRLNVLGLLLLKMGGRGNALVSPQLSHV